jgi:hypothetical protein
MGTIDLVTLPGNKNNNYYVYLNLIIGEELPGNLIFMYIYQVIAYVHDN